MAKAKPEGENMLNPRLNTYQDYNYKVCIFHWVMVIASVLLAGCTICFVTAAWNSSNPKNVHIFAAIWAIAPPICFWVEYFCFYRKYGKRGTLELFKHGQQLAGAIWAGIAISLVALGSSDHFKQPEAPPIIKPIKASDVPLQTQK